MFSLKKDKRFKKRKKRMDLFFVILAFILVIAVMQTNNDSFFPGLSSDTPEIFDQLEQIQEEVTPLTPLTLPEEQERCTLRKKTDAEGNYIACITSCNGLDTLEDARSEPLCTTALTENNQ